MHPKISEAVLNCYCFGIKRYTKTKYIPQASCLFNAFQVALQTLRRYSFTFHFISTLCSGISNSPEYFPSMSRGYTRKLFNYRRQSFHQKPMEVLNTFSYVDCWFFESLVQANVMYVQTIFFRSPKKLVSKYSRKLKNFKTIDYNVFKKEGSW